MSSAPYEDLARLVERFIAEASKNPGLLNLDSDLRLDKPELKVSVNRDKIVDVGASVDAVGRTLESMLGGRQVTRFKRDGEQYDVMVQVAPYDRATPSDIRGDALAGLAATPKRLPSKYFYDARGSQLFERITRQPEYYVTRVELQLLEQRLPAAAQPAGKETLHQHRVLWLEHGYLEGDDTDAHIDTLARFASPSRIVYQGCQDTADSHYGELQAMAAELRALRRTDGTPYELFELPWPQPVLDGGRRLAASYANFLIVNGAVLMPVYGDAADAEALAVMARAFPSREIVGIPCRDLIWQNGSLHCCTMQLPEGLST